MNKASGLRGNTRDVSLHMRCYLCGHMLSRPVYGTEADLKAVENEILDLLKQVTE